MGTERERESLDEHILEFDVVRPQISLLVDKIWPRVFQRSLNVCEGERERERERVSQEPREA